MSLVQRSVEVDVSVEELFKVVTDYKRYEEFVSEMREVRVGERDPRGRLPVTYTIEIDAGIASKRISYTLLHSETAPREVRWELVKGEMMKTNSGSWALAPLADNRTRATYAIDISFGLLVPKAVSNFLTERNLPRMLGEFKARAEQLRARR